MTHDIWITDHTVLAVLAELRGARACLEGAEAACEALDAATVTALHVRVDPMTDIMPTEEMLSRDQEREMELEAAKEGHALHDIYAAWIAALPSRIDTNWEEVKGGEAHEVKEYGAQAGLTVMIRPQKDGGGHARTAFHSCMFSTGRPLLVVPETYRRHTVRRILVAWKDSDPSRRALECAAPWLKRAEIVRLVRIGEEKPAELEWAQQRLRDLEVKSEIKDVCRRDDISVGTQLIAEAAAMEADWIVCGAFHHGQIVEWILGGVTETLLDDAPLPVFMMH